MSSEDPVQACGRHAQRTARIAGALYLVIIVLGLLGETVIRNSLVVGGNAAETASRILASEWLWRLGVAGQLLLLLCAVGLSLAWYVLLKPVNKTLTLLAMFFALVSLAVESVSALQLQAVLAPLLAAAQMGIDARQAQAMAYMAVVGHSHAFALALLFFGVECVIVGHLVRRSGYLPAPVGVLMQVAGVCYVANTFAMVLSPPCTRCCSRRSWCPRSSARAHFACACCSRASTSRRGNAGLRWRRHAISSKPKEPYHEPDQHQQRCRHVSS